MKYRLTALIVVIGVLFLLAVADVQAFGQRSCAEDALCGPRCLLLVFGQYDVEADLEELAAACGIEKGPMVPEQISGTIGTIRNQGFQRTNGRRVYCALAPRRQK